MKFVVFSITNPLNPQQVAWGWAFVDTNGNRGVSVQSFASSENASTNLKDFLATLFVDWEGVTIEVEE